MTVHMNVIFIKDFIFDCINIFHTGVLKLCYTELFTTVQNEIFSENYLSHKQYSSIK